MKNIKCSDCAEYHNEWCEKIIDSPYPDMLRDCQYWHERKDMVEVVRCKDCIYFDKYIDCKKMYQWDGFCADWARKTYEKWYCSRAERRSDETDY